MTEKMEDDWLNTANDFYRRTQYPKRTSAMNGKHVWIKMPSGSGSLFYNYKHFFSILLLASAEANYHFISVNVEAVGKSSDSNVFKNSNIGRKQKLNQQGIPRSSSCLMTRIWNACHSWQLVTRLSAFQNTCYSPTWIGILALNKE
jgi:hypothetical protein